MKIFVEPFHNDYIVYAILYNGLHQNEHIFDSFSAAYRKAVELSGDGVPIWVDQRLVKKFGLQDYFDQTLIM